jgi:hypothetical protein
MQKPRARAVAIAETKSLLRIRLFVLAVGATAALLAVPGLL